MDRHISSAEMSQSSDSFFGGQKSENIIGVLLIILVWCWSWGTRLKKKKKKTVKGVILLDQKPQRNRGQNWCWETEQRGRTLRNRTVTVTQQQSPPLLMSEWLYIDYPLHPFLPPDANWTKPLHGGWVNQRWIQNTTSDPNRNKHVNANI